METFEVWPNFESFHSSCPMRFFVENLHTKNQGHKTTVLILYVGGSAPPGLPLPQGKDTCQGCVDNHNYSKSQFQEINRNVRIDNS